MGDMTNSKHIAKLLGPFLIAMTISEILNPRIRDTVAITQIYPAGFLLLLAGLSIIRSHNYWTFKWPVMITIIGWFAIPGGLSRMFFLMSSQQGAQNTSVVQALQIILPSVGIILTFKAYVANFTAMPSVLDIALYAIAYPFIN
jgi:hypothetical protein